MRGQKAEVLQEERLCQHLDDAATKQSADKVRNPFEIHDLHPRSEKQVDVNSN